MTRFWLSAAAMAALAACQPTVPDSAAGVGFDDYSNYATEQAATRAAREAQLSGRTNVLPPEQTGAPAASSSGAAGLTAADLAAAGIGQRSAAASGPAAIPPAGAPSPGAVQQAEAPSEPLSALAPGALQASAAPSGGPAAISDEQDFRAVSARETISSDAERLAQQRAQYRQVQVSTAADAGVDGGPDIVAYALRTNNSVGQQIYNRMFASEAKMRRNCARFAAPDIAQRTFLAEGGPRRDRMGLDADGDGFACGWSPEPFRAAVRG